MVKCFTSFFSNTSAVWARKQKLKFTTLATKRRKSLQTSKRGISLKNDDELIVEKGVFSKPSGNHIVAPIFCFLSKRLQILATCLFFKFAKLCKV